MARPRILVVIASLTYPMRVNVEELIFGYRKYLDAEVYYLNLAHKSAPAFIAHLPFHLIVVQSTFFTRMCRSPRHNALMRGRLTPVAKNPAPKAAVFQDEFIGAAMIEACLLDFGFDVAFPVSAPSLWPTLYPKIDFNKVLFRRVLTGYLYDDQLEAIVARGARREPRVNDVGYRTAGAPHPAWGRLGHMKKAIADAFLETGPRLGLKVDIATDAAQAIPSSKWFDFLADCRWTIGVESGASVIDRDGSIHRAIDAALAAEPELSFEELERRHFPGLDNNPPLLAIGPRHLEACATRTAQALVLGDYGGILKAGKHYLPIQPDLRNVGEVAQAMKSEELRSLLAEAAFDTVVASRAYLFSTFFEFVVEEGLNLLRQSIRAPTLLEKSRLAALRGIEEAEFLAARTAIRAARHLTARHGG